MHVVEIFNILDHLKAIGKELFTLFFLKKL